MDGIRLLGSQTNGFTPIPDSFIDHYVPEANGNYVKVYLFLLRHLHSRASAFTVSDIADHFEFTENDVHRALSYWQKKSLLDVQMDDGRHISQITLTNPDDAFRNPSDAPPLAATVEAPPPEAGVVRASRPSTKDLPEMAGYSVEQIAQFTKNEELQSLLDVLEYLKGPLSSQHQDLVLYLYDQLHFPSELIIHLYEYCLSRRKESFSYIQSVALAWAEQGVDSVEKAKAASLQYNETYLSIMKSLGLDRTPAVAEKEYIDKWISYGFDLSVIVEACNRTILHIQKPDFKYANGVLENWRKQGVRTPEDVAKTDEDFRQKGASTKTLRISNANTVKKPSGQFYNFPQRQYSSEEFTSLEQRLLKRTMEETCH